MLVIGVFFFGIFLDEVGGIHLCCPVIAASGDAK